MILITRPLITFIHHKLLAFKCLQYCGFETIQALIRINNGHTDDQGTEDNKMKMPEKPFDNVNNYLIEKGLNSDKISKKNMVNLTLLARIKLMLEELKRGKLKLSL